MASKCQDPFHRSCDHAEACELAGTLECGGCDRPWDSDYPCPSEFCAEGRSK